MKANNIILKKIDLFISLIKHKIKDEIIKQFNSL